MDIPEKIIKEFGGNFTLELLQGGQGKTYRSGDVVFKQCVDEFETECLSEIMCKLSQKGFRRACPVKSKSGKWVIDGWQAFEFVNGKPGIVGREKEALNACQALHNAIRNVYTSSECPAWLEHREDFWIVSDQLAWGKLDPTNHIEFQMLSEIQYLYDHLYNIDHLTSQIVHCDPGGDNVLFSPNQAPALIDISPYWHPTGYSNAMMLSDAVAWEGSIPDVLNLCSDENQFDQLLLRAVLFRISIPALRNDIKGFRSELNAYLPVLDFISLDS